jgi:type III pantothenate kinase
VLNLIIDIGNTRTKVAIFNQGELMVSIPMDEITPAGIDLLKQEYMAMDAVIVSSTRNIPEDLALHLYDHFETVIVLNHNTPIPIENLYKTPETLGKDRLAAAVGGNFLFPNQPLLIIDAGTAITYDYVNEKNQYTGGFITPGLTMRYKALHQFTDKLPLLEPALPENYNGDTTESAIHGGILLGIKGEIESMIKKNMASEDILKIILTGGDSYYFEKLLKSYNFVPFEVTLIGLNRILEFNQLIKTKKNG